MSIDTKIGWCDSTVNPIMGCGFCELWSHPSQILRALDEALAALMPGRWSRGDAETRFRRLIDEASQNLLATLKGPGEGHTDEMTATNIYHLRKDFKEGVRDDLGVEADREVERVLRERFTCYAAKLHANKAYAITNPQKKVNSGYAPTFEQVTRFPGRLA